MQVRGVIKRLERDGWKLVRTTGNHRQFRHASKAGTVTVAGRPNKEIAPGTLKSIWKQAQLEVRP